ncbi:protein POLARALIZATION DURING ASYMMETRIC DIVISION AND REDISTRIBUTION-like [Primulina huaijiensis]|uniref:protein POLARALIZATION DURING ASYMMETRIC DIVISION AND REDISTRIBUTION-like n=1 Tax=Primulina huaijiensis TaxID=1492673 RepID=UPI003CC732B8
MMDDGTVAADMDQRCRKRRVRSCRSFASCISPRLILSRWLNGGNSRGDKNEMGKIWEMPKIGENFGVNRRRVNGSMDFGRSPPSFAPKSSEEIGKEASFNLGVGFGLMFLIAASRNELNKMVNLHRQMQILFQSFRTEFQNNQEKEHCSDFMMASSFPNLSDIQEISYVEKTVCSQYLSSHNFESPKVNFSSGQHIRENSRGMDQIGDELEAELDRMQLQVDTEVPSKYSKLQHSERNVEDSAPEMSLTSSFEDIGKQPYQLMMCNQDQFCGIDPFELERRLHQVLEARQQEEITELSHQLELKEAELSWWKDTVRLISQHAEEPVYGTESEH